jgi:hypothetical protein
MKNAALELASKAYLAPKNCAVHDRIPTAFGHFAYRPS